MSPEVMVLNEQVQTAPSDVQFEEMLTKVVDAVRRDSRQAPEGFLAETVVPHGGE